MKLYITNKSELDQYPDAKKLHQKAFNELFHCVNVEEKIPIDIHVSTDTFFTFERFRDDVFFYSFNSVE